MLCEFAGVVNTLDVYVEDWTDGGRRWGIVVQRGGFFVWEDEGGAEEAGDGYDDVYTGVVGVVDGGFEGGD